MYALLKFFWAFKSCQNVTSKLNLMWHCDNAPVIIAPTSESLAIEVSGETLRRRSLAKASKGEGQFGVQVCGPQQDLRSQLLREVQCSHWSAAIEVQPLKCSHWSEAIEVKPLKWSHWNSIITEVYRVQQSLARMFQPDKAKKGKRNAVNIHVVLEILPCLALQLWHAICEYWHHTQCIPGMTDKFYKTMLTMKGAMGCSFSLCPKCEKMNKKSGKLWNVWQTQWNLWRNK